MSNPPLSLAPRARQRLSLVVLATVALLMPIAGCTADEADVGVTPISPDAWLSSPPPNALLLDVRTPDEFAKGHVPGAINIPYDEIPNRLDELEGGKDRAVVVYCESGKRAGKAESTLAAQGYTNLHHLEGDMKGWRAAGRETSVPN